jgi:DNA-binding SARP family transcriptional activator
VTSKGPSSPNNASPQYQADQPIFALLGRCYRSGTAAEDHWAVGAGGQMTVCGGAGPVTGQAPLRFRVLGPVDVLAGEHQVALPGGRARAVLAVLVLHANQVVSADRLIEGAWGDAPPVTARTQLQGLVSMLRRALARPDVVAARELIRTHGRGYRLDLAPGASDLGTFRATLARARSALAAADRSLAVRYFTEALALWRGPAFDGIASHLLEAEAAQLDQLRVVAGLDCARAMLDLGRHREALVRLVGLVGERPLDEDARELLMLALYRSGRRAEALTEYRRVRQTLIGEVGIEPGPSLRELHRRILVDDPELVRVGAGPDADSPGSPGSHPGWGLPPGVASRSARLPAGSGERKAASVRSAVISTKSGPKTEGSRTRRTTQKLFDAP